MTMFFVTFFTLYAALHAYVFIKAWHAFRFRLLPGCVIALLFLLCVFAPMIVRSLEQGGQEGLARGLAYAGYIWMSAVFIFFALSLGIDIIRFFAMIVSSIFKVALPRAVHSHLILFLVSASATIFVVAYGYHEALAIRTETVIIETGKLPAGVEKLTIVQVSDLHLGLVNRDGRLKRVVSAVKEAAPDILVSTGDLVDGQLNNLNGLSDLLSGINPRYGKYAVMGNHEFYAGVGASEDFTRKAGFRMLRRKAVTVEGIINIAGIDDAVRWSRSRSPSGETALLEGLPRNLFTVFLKHRPDVENSSIGLFDIQLSGHTHGGQIFPFGYVTRISFPRLAGLYPLGKGSLLYVSRGTGTWGPPIRFFTPPEVTVIEIIRKP